MSKRARNKHSVGVSQDPIIFNCNFCSYKTKSETGMKMHTKVSHKMKADIDKRNILEMCEFCGMTFRENREIKKHVKTSHRQT